MSTILVLFLLTGVPAGAGSPPAPAPVYWEKTHKEISRSAVRIARIDADDRLWEDYGLRLDLDCDPDVPVGAFGCRFWFFGNDAKNGTTLATVPTCSWGGHSLREWIIGGSDWEDSEYGICDALLQFFVTEFNASFFNHFYNPFWQTQPPTYLGGVDSGGDRDDDTLDQEGGFLDRAPARHFGRPSMEWALDGGDPGIEMQYTDQDNVWAWDRAREAFHLALLNCFEDENQRGDPAASCSAFAMNPNHTLPHGKTARAFRALGHQLHWIQDLASRAHVRNDAHPSLSYEEWLAKRPALRVADFEGVAQVVLDQLEARLSQLPSGVALQDFYDCVPRGGAFDPQSSLGLAEYTCRNFLSEHSIPYEEKERRPWYRRKAFEFPRITDQRVAFDQFPLADREYALTTYEDPLAIGENPYVYLKVRHAWCERTGRRVVPFTTRDPLVREDHASRLLPRAIAYSAAVINYFFRGQIEVDATRFDYDPGTGDLINVHVEVRNATANGEPMAGGDVALAYAYDDPSGSRVVDSYLVGSSLAVSSAAPSVFDFPIQIPAGSSKFKFYFAYKGLLGAEPNAVVGKLLQHGVDVGFAIDGTGYMTNPEFARQTEGLAQAVETGPVDGSVGLTVVLFEGCVQSVPNNWRVVVPYTTVDDQDEADTIAELLRDLQQRGDSCCYNPGVGLTKVIEELANSSRTDVDQVLVASTYAAGTYSYGGLTVDGVLQDAMQGDLVDEFDVLLTRAHYAAIWTPRVFPQPDSPGNPPEPGFVEVVLDETTYRDKALSILSRE